MSYVLKSLPFICAALISIQMAHAENDKGYISAPDQHRAIADCHYELGKQGYPKLQATYVAYPWGGDTVLRILPGNNVTSGEAAWINACADTKLGRARGVTQATPRHVSRGGCPRRAAPLYRGSGYCIGSSY